jgi:hypothetical protein
MSKKHREKKHSIAAQAANVRKLKAEKLASTATFQAPDPSEMIMTDPSPPPISNVTRLPIEPDYSGHGEDMAKLLAAADAAENGCAMSDAVLVTADEVETWTLPKFQRTQKDNAKVDAYREKVRVSDGCVSGGVITLGRIPGDPNIYKVDGQHRLYAALTSGVIQFLLTIHIKRYADFGEMANDYIELQDSLVPMRRDDVLKAAMENKPSLQAIVTQCSFVGFDQIRRATTAQKLVSMSAVLNCWIGSDAETPGAKSSGRVPDNLPDSEVSNLCMFLNLCYSAWGNHSEYFRLWGNLNMCMLMWMFRQLVLKNQIGIARKLTHTTIDANTFRKCMVAITSDSNYYDWLYGKNMRERDRGPCYRKLRDVFVRRLNDEEIKAGRVVKKLKFPSPAWSKGRV